MSATNTTTNYSLPIFIGSDKPAWLVDFNGAMNAIDAQMKVNADAIATKSPILTFNDTTEIDFTKSGNIITANLASGVSDKVGRALVTPISAPAEEEIVSINTSGVQSSLQAGKGIIIDNGEVQTTVDMNLHDISQVNLASCTPYGSTPVAATKSGTVTVALNADKSVGKVYGSLYITNPAANTDYGYYLGKSVTPPADGVRYLIDAGIAYTTNASGQIVYIGTAYVFVEADGQLVVYSRSGGSASSRLWAKFEAPIYFFKDFGDQ